jgi:hypothetical protein
MTPIETPIERYRSATHELEPLLDRVSTLGAQRAAALADMRRDGMSLQQIAAATGLSAGRVQELSKQGGWQAGEGGGRPGRPVDLRRFAKEAYRYVLSWKIDDVPGHETLLHSAALLPSSEHRIEADPYTALCELVTALDHDVLTDWEPHRELAAELRRRIVEALSGHTARSAHQKVDPRDFPDEAWVEAERLLDDPGQLALLRDRLTPAGPAVTAQLINLGVIF